MKKHLLLATLTTLVSLSSFATIDSYVTIKYPVQGMHEAGYCIIDSLAWDGISNIGTKEMLATQALNGPFKIPGIQAGEDSDGLVQVNALYESGVKVDLSVDMETFDKGSLVVNASEASAKAKTLEERDEVIKKVKVAIYAGMANALSGIVPVVKLELVGLPNQAGIKNQVPAVFRSSFSKNSPYLQGLKKELNIVDGKKGCI